MTEASLEATEWESLLDFKSTSSAEMGAVSPLPVLTEVDVLFPASLILLLFDRDLFFFLLIRLAVPKCDFMMVVL